MNAQQRRTERRKPRFVFDMESDFFVGGNFRPLLGDFFDFSSVRPAGDRLSDTLRILKARESAHNSVYDQIVLNMDFTKVEARIATFWSADDIPKQNLTPYERELYGNIASLAMRYERGVDRHQQRAAEMFNVAYEDVTPEQRAAGKRSNFAQDYS